MPRLKPGDFLRHVANEDGGVAKVVILSGNGDLLVEHPNGTLTAGRVNELPTAEEEDKTPVNGSSCPIALVLAWRNELEHQRRFGRVPRVVAADAAFYSQANVNKVREMGVSWVAVPNRSTHSEERRKLQKRCWFHAAQKWRTGCEGRISVLKRRHGLDRCRYRGLHGMERWVGLGVIADNLIQIGTRLAVQRA